MNEVVLGIDFGTYGTSAGALVGERVELIQDNGDPVIPTVVYLPARGVPEIGRRALIKQITEPQRVVRSIKRLMGLPAGAAMAKRFAAGAPFRVDIAGERISLRVGNDDYAPEQIAAQVLSRVRDLAEARFGGRIKKAVVTMSAYPPAGYRDAIIRAARVAHLEVLDLIAEPIAGALAFGAHGQTTERRLLVLDFGGGTFDVCAVQQAGLKFAPVATFADPYLGGDDFDYALAEGIAGAVVRASGYDMHKDAVRWTELVYRAEMTKRQLSTAPEVAFAMRDAYMQNGQARDIDQLLDRRWAEAKWQSLLDRTKDVIVETLARAQWTAEHVDQIVLIGGTSLIPAFRRMVGAMFTPAKILASLHADLAVAMGATLVTGRYGRGVPTLAQLAA